MLAEALRAEADAFIASFAEEWLADGCQRVVRHGFGPECSIQTGIGLSDERLARGFSSWQGREFEIAPAG